MNKAQVNGMRGQTRTWSSAIVDTQFFTDCVGNQVKIFNPHLIVGYYTQTGEPLYQNLDFTQPLIQPELIYPNTQSLPFDAINYANNYAYSPFSSFTQTKAGGVVPQPPDPSAPLTLSNYDLQPLSEMFFYWYKVITRSQSEARSSTGLGQANVLLKGNPDHDEVANAPVTSINNNFASFSSFNFIDMLDESYCDISKYFVHNTTTAWGGVNRVFDTGVYNDWENYFSVTLIQIIYLDRGHGFEFERTIVP